MLVYGNYLTTHFNARLSACQFMYFSGTNKYLSIVINVLMTTSFYNALLVNFGNHVQRSEMIHSKRMSAE